MSRRRFQRYQRYHWVDSVYRHAKWGNWERDRSPYDPAFPALMSPDQIDEYREHVASQMPAGRFRDAWERRYMKKAEQQDA